MKWRIGELLLQKKLISWDQLEDVLSEQEKTRELIGSILLRKGLLSENLLYKVLAEQHDLKFVELRRTRINPKAVEVVPADYARKYSVMPIEYREGRLILAIPSPLHMWSEDELKRIPAISEIQTVLCLPGEVSDFLKNYYPN